MSPSEKTIVAIIRYAARQEFKKELAELQQKEQAVLKPVERTSLRVVYKNTKRG